MQGVDVAQVRAAHRHQIIIQQAFGDQPVIAAIAMTHRQVDAVAGEIHQALAGADAYIDTALLRLETA
ncbi:hypothetical protein D3C84_1191050 [compost metagenome]